MKIAPLLLVLLVFAACGGGEKSEEPSATKTPAATQSAEDAEKAVTKMFDDYRAALLDRDWDEACSHLAPETTDKLKSNLETAGVKDPPDECEELMDALYTAIDKQPDQKKLVDEIAKTGKMDSVTVNGDKATLNWSATVNGAKTPVTQTARIIDGEWKLIDVN